MHYNSIPIVATPVEPDEYLVDPGTLSVYLATVVPALRLVDGNNLRSASRDYVGALSATGA